MALAPAAALAQSPSDEERLEDIEEQVLRQQVEMYLNDFARWDDKKRRIVIGREGQDELEKAKGELGALQPVVEMMLARLIEKGEDGRLKIKDSMKLRPFAQVIQDYIQDGGMEDLEAFQRYRSGNGENPFKGGMPKRANKAITGLLKALNDQGKTPKADERRDEPDERRTARRPEPRTTEPRAPEPERGEPRARRPEGRAPEERAPQGMERLMAELRERVSKRFDLEPEEIDELMRYVREMGQEGHRELDRMRDEMRERMEDMRRSEGGRDMDERLSRLARRAEDELRRFMESEETQERLSELEKKAMDFIASPEGQELQRKVLEFLASDNGAKIREKLGEFMASDRGRELMKKLGERMAGGGKPKATPAPEPRREERRIETERRPAEERPAPEPRRARDERRRTDRKPTEF